MASRICCLFLTFAGNCCPLRKGIITGMLNYGRNFHLWKEMNIRGKKILKTTIFSGVWNFPRFSLCKTGGKKCEKFQNPEKSWSWKSFWYLFPFSKFWLILVAEVWSAIFALSDPFLGHWDHFEHCYCPFLVWPHFPVNVKNNSTGFTWTAEPFLLSLQTINIEFITIIWNLHYCLPLSPLLTVELKGLPISHIQ